MQYLQFCVIYDVAVSIYVLCMSHNYCYLQYILIDRYRIFINVDLILYLFIEDILLFMRIYESGARFYNGEVTCNSNYL